MAERRMFAKTIIDSDAFLDMPITARLLYYDLSMRADDDGFVNSPRKIQRMIGASDDDLRILAARKFIIPFESGVVVIKHWRIHNYIRKDTYSETPYRAEKEQLEVDENKGYTLKVAVPSTSRQLPVDEPSTQVRIGKDRLGKDNIDIGGRKTPTRATFAPPSIEEVTAYCEQSGIKVDAERFIDYYESNGWMVGKNKMKSWKAAVRNWSRNDYSGRRKQDDRKRDEDRGDLGEHFNPLDYL